MRLPLLLITGLALLVGACENENEFFSEHQLISDKNAQFPLGNEITVYGLKGDGEYQISDDGDILKLDIRRVGNCYITTDQDDDQTDFSIVNLHREIWVFGTPCENPEGPYRYLLLSIEDVGGQTQNFGSVGYELAGSGWVNSFSDWVRSLDSEQRRAWGVDVQTTPATTALFGPAADIDVQSLDPVRSFATDIPRQKDGSLVTQTWIGTTRPPTESEIAEAYVRHEESQPAPGSTALATPEASHSVTICNEIPNIETTEISGNNLYRSLVSLTIGYYDTNEQEWYSQGWIHISGASCNQLDLPVAIGENFYLHGNFGLYAENISNGSFSEFDIEGIYEFCIGSQDDFVIAGNRRCVSRGHRLELFHQVEIDPSRDNTIEIRNRGTITVYQTN